MTRTRALVLSIVAVVVVIAAGAAWFLLTRRAGPDATARAYLEALEAGDGARALELVADPRDGDAHVAAAFDGAQEYLSDPVLRSVGGADGEQPRAEVTFTLNGAEHSASFGLVERDGRWLVDDDAVGVLRATTTLGDAVLIGAVAAPADADATLLPAVYPVEAAPPGILTGSAPATVLPGETTEAHVEATVSPDATALAQEQLDAYAAHCAQASDAVPANCGLRVPWAADLASLTTIAFRVEQTPQVVLSPDLRTFDATGGIIVATATGVTRSGDEASFTYRADDWALRGTIALTADGMQLAVG